MMDAVVVIPIYKEKPSDEELFNLDNNIGRLTTFDIFFVGPYDKDFSFYRNRYPSTKIKLYDKKFFASINAYNKLMLSVFFYEEFENYDYMLICQPDALVLKDGEELKKFMKLGYSYYGAPWYSGDHITLLPNTNKLFKLINLIFPKHYVDVGNGGFSLRKVDSTINLLRDHSLRVKTWMHYEDYFYAFMGRYVDKEYLIPPREIAMKFALEIDAEEVIRETGNIPFGVHAYKRYYPNLVKDCFYCFNKG